MGGVDKCSLFDGGEGYLVGTAREDAGCGKGFGNARGGHYLVVVGPAWKKLAETSRLLTQR